MKRTWMMKAMLAAALLAAMPAAEARGFGVRGRVFVGPSFGSYGYWGPYGAYGPYGYPGYYGYGYGVGIPMNPHRGSGQVKFDTKQKDAQVYIDGAYAGTAKEMNSAWLKQGDYNVEVKAANGQDFQTDLYVIAGHTVHVHPQFPGDTR